MTIDPHPMHIGEVAEATGMSLRTLRHYDEVGLLKPSGRTEGGFRLYSQADMERLLLIRRMKPLGFTLEEMSSLLEIVDQSHSEVSTAPSAASRARFDAFIADVEQRREKLRTQLDMADEFLERLYRQRSRSVARDDVGVTDAAGL
jgi:DNA-binding transcriptional MerR regulator